MEELEIRVGEIGWRHGEFELSKEVLRLEETPIGPLTTGKRNHF
jgi:hypothetical protein